MYLIEFLGADPLTLLGITIAGIDGAHSPATIWAYFSDSAAFIALCDLRNQPAFAC